MTTRPDYITRPLIFLGGTEHQYVKTRRYIGVEIEVATSTSGCHTEQACAKWHASIVSDGSLPSQTGYEINTQPCRGDIFVTQIKDLSCALAQDGATVNTQCGLHVHIDCRRESYAVLQRIGLLYQRIQHTLQKMVPPSRSNNQYCIPLDSDIERFLHATTNEDRRRELAYAVFNRPRVPRSLRSNKYGGKRYCALNYASWYYRGTVEFRLFGGTVSPDKILPWALLCAHIVDTAKALSVADIAALPHESEGLIDRVDGALFAILHDTLRLREFAKVRLSNHRFSIPQ